MGVAILSSKWLYKWLMEFVLSPFYWEELQNIDCSNVNLMENQHNTHTHTNQSLFFIGFGYVPQVSHKLKQSWPMIMVKFVHFLIKCLKLLIANSSYVKFVVSPIKVN